MNPTNESVKQFFEQYERGADTLDLDLVNAQYADWFMFADASGTRVVEKQKFLAVLPKRQEFFKTLGLQSTRVVSVEQTALSDRYVLARVRFLFHFEQAPGQPVDAEIDSTFILHVENGSPKIVFHLEHDDIQHALQARGALPTL